jgi:hypothetical protein
LSLTAKAPGDGERTAGEQRLRTAVAEQQQARELRDAAKGTAREVEAAVLTQAADERVNARERWIEWVAQRDHDELVAR